MTGEVIFQLHEDHPHLNVARQILRNFLTKCPVVQYASSCDFGLFQDPEKLFAMKLAITAENFSEWPDFKAAVERQYAARGIAPDQVFNFGGRRHVQPETWQSRAGIPEYEYISDAESMDDEGVDSEIDAADADDDDYEMERELDAEAEGGEADFVGENVSGDY